MKNMAKNAFIEIVKSLKQENAFLLIKIENDKKNAFHELKKQ
jgi:hypothetical protein